MESNSMLWAEDMVKAKEKEKKEDMQIKNAKGDMPSDMSELSPRKKKSSFEMFEAEDFMAGDYSMTAEEKYAYENTAKQIEEKLQENYDADLDSAFADKEN